VLIEHGNRFDEWNVVSHNALRRVRSQVSRAQPIAPEFPAVPGSRLVEKVLNPLKKDYAFIDLLKPEDAAAMPVAAALGATGFSDAWQFFKRFRQTWSVDFDENRQPINEEFIRAPAAGAGAAPSKHDQEMYTLAQDIAAGGNAEQISTAGDLLRGIGGKITEKVREARRAALFVAMSKTLDTHRDAFDVAKESDTYLIPARDSARRGFQVVIYGHTHLAKR
jgi:hypothetical protein